MTNSPITRRCATLVALSALALAAPDAQSFTGPSTPSQDLRSPDARAAATASGPSPDSVSSSHDLRSPDLRSPDTRDVAIGYDPEPVAAALPEPSGSGERFDWVTAAIGGAAVGGVILLLFGLSIGRGGVGRIGRRGALRT